MTDQTLDRLSAANPFRATTPEGADALFDRIVLTPANPRLTGAPRRRRRPALVLVTAVVVCGLLASAAYGISSLLGGAIGGPTVRQEYLQAQKRLTLPPGYTWPKFHWPPHTVTSVGMGGGLAVSADQGAWECYWVDAINAGDAAAGRRAQAALDDLMTNHSVVAPAGASENWSPPQSDNPLQVFAADGGYQHKQRIYAAAAAGRPQGLAQSCRVNGPGVQG